MSETVALTRLALQKHRLSLIFTVALVAIGVLSAHVLAANGGPREQRFAIMALFVTMLPAIVWTFAMFAFSSDRDLLVGESGYLHWLLRLPIADWKLAMVPVALKTVWISLLWISFALTLRSIADAKPYLFGPAIGFSSVGVWLMVLMWRPFTNGWWRLGALIGCGLVLYVLVVGLLIELEEGDPGPIRWLWPAVTVGTCGMFLLGAWMSVRAIHLARTNALGIIPETGKLKTLVAQSAGDLRVVLHNSPRAALVWHDLQKSREIVRLFVMLGVIPAIIIFTLFIWFSVQAYVFVMILFTSFAFAASGHVLDRTDKGSIVLPPYLAASPLGTATIAWTRMLTIVTIVAVGLSLTLVVFAGWTLFPENRATWSRWAGELAAETDSPSAGLRIATATFLLTWLILIGRAIAYIWPALCGRTWVSFTVAVLSIFAFMIPVSVVIGWFLRQTSWESTEQSALYWLTYLPALVIGWLVLKMILVVISILQLRGRQLASTMAIGWIVGGWLLVTCASAGALHLLIPYPQATLLWCFAAVAICLPLARILVLPLSLHFGRHR